MKNDQGESIGKPDKRNSLHEIEEAKVLEHAFAVFESEGKVTGWINMPNRALNNVRPIDLFHSPAGLKMVSDILGRIEHGIFS